MVYHEQLIHKIAEFSLSSIRKEQFLNKILSEKDFFKSLQFNTIIAKILSKLYTKKLL